MTQVSLQLTRTDDNGTGNKYQCFIHLLPVCRVSEASNGTSGSGYLTGRPYPHDADPFSDVLWRLTYPERETQIWKSINMADRGSRLKALRVVEAVVQNDGIFTFLQEYVKSV